jgi:hypothetical protein
MHTRVFLVAVSMMLVATQAHAVSQVLQQTCDIALMLWVWIRGAVYILASISLAMMSIQASALGKFSMGRFITWGAALFALSSVPAILAFFTEGSAGLNCNLYNTSGGGGPV